MINKDNDLNNISFLKDKYKYRINECKKDVYEIINYIKKNLSVIENVQNEKLYLNEVEFTKINSLSSWRNIEMKYKYNDLNVIAFEIIKDSKSEIYYKSHSKDVITPKGNIVIPNRIIIILETKTEYIYCNNDLLYKDLKIYQGISENDIINETPQLITYLKILDEK